MFMTKTKILILIALTIALAACQATPDRDERAEIVDHAQVELKRMKAKDPQLEPLLDDCAGYAIFPEVGKGGLLFAGAFGRGAVYDNDGDFLGYASVTQVSVGGVVGGQSYAQLLVFGDNARLDDFMNGNGVRFGSQAVAVAVTDGAANASEYDNGVKVFIMPRGGLMADASLSGQEFKFVRAEDVDKYDGATAATPQD
jgi:lipid-binding SYLF domain-containing protein